MMEDYLMQAHGAVTAAMQTRGRGHLPLTLAYVDWETGVLTAGLDFRDGPSEETFAHLRYLTCGLPLRLQPFTARRHMSNQNRIRPVVGGIQMVVNRSYQELTGTICIGCSYDDGSITPKHGVLVSGHVVSKTNTTVYQNSKVSQDNIGKVQVITNWKNGSCDAAFVAKTAAAAVTKGEIWTAAGPYLRVTAAADGHLIVPGLDVKMLGMNNEAPQEGRVVATGVSVTFAVGDLDEPQTLTNQVLASYLSEEGDSGGPVYVQVGTNTDVTFCGINVGACSDSDVTASTPAIGSGTYGIFSPWPQIDAAFGGNLDVLSA
ncbi:hypothetical protein [Pannonibacter anstelovis]